MSDTVLVALITFVASPVVLAVLNRMQTRRLGDRIGGIEAKTEAVREQVQNSHRTNFRDDHDALRDEVREGFDDIRRRQDAQGTRIAGVDRKVTSLTKRFEAHIDGNN